MTTINEGGQAPCESTDGCTRAQVTLEQAISHAGTDHAMAAQPVPPSPDTVCHVCYQNIEERGGAHPAPPPAPPSPAWKIGNEFAPYHPSASHVPPDYRDGWNACYALAADAIAALRAERDALRAALRQIYFLDHNEREWESVQEVKLFAERAAIDAARGKV